MEVSAEAKRIMVVALGKLYSSRTQRGGLRLHRSLLLTLVMKSARDMYHAAQATRESVASDWEDRHGHQPQQPAVETTSEPELCAPRTSPPEEVSGGPSAETALRPDAQTRTGAEDKENVRPPGPPPQHARKRRGKAAAEPDFLPCKKARLDQGNCPQHLVISSVLMDYVKCGAELGATPTPIPIQTAVAAC